MSSTRRRNARMLALLGSLLAAMTGLVAYAPTLLPDLLRSDGVRHAT